MTRTVPQLLEYMTPRTWPSDAAYRAAVRVFVVRASGRLPVPAREDPAGNCLACGEAGRCPGWHFPEEFAHADIQPFTLKATA